MESNRKEINNESGIGEKKETNHDMEVKKRHISTNNIKPENIQKSKKFRKYRKNLWIIESLVAKCIFAVAIVVIILIVKNLFLTSTKSSSEPVNDSKHTYKYMERFLKRRLVTCPAGYFLNGRTCKKCNAGTYSTYGKNICLTCNSGTYSKSGASSCTQCSAGTYSKAGSSFCSACGPGTYSEKGASICKKCLAGTYSFFGGSTCKKCLPGTYSLSGASTCKKCLAGTFSSSAGASICNKCIAGTYSKEGASICNSCLPGTYSIIGSSKCTPCPEGKYSLRGYSSCLNCKAGYYSKKGASDCSKCPSGTFSYMGSGSCTKCPAGTYSTIGSSTCNKCNAGYISKIGSSSCTKCPAGTTSKIGSSSCSKLCNPGHYYYLGICKICPGGTHSVSDFSKCLECPKGTSSSSGSENCKKCPPGTYSSSSRSTICLECPAGTYSGIGDYLCKKCPYGTTSKKGSSKCLTEIEKGAKKIVSFAISSIIHNLEEFARKHNIDTAKIGGTILNMKEDRNGIYHAEFDCWQHLFGYNKLYDLVFDLGTSMDLNNEGMFTYHGKNYIFWAWKGDYINLGAGAELGIYYGGLSRNSHWKVDKNLAMPMTLNLTHKTKGTIVSNWDNWGKDAWWITAFNPKPKYKNLNANDLTARFSVKFKDIYMFNVFSSTKRKGWEYDNKNRIAYLVL